MRRNDRDHSRLKLRTTELRGPANGSARRQRPVEVLVTGPELGIGLTRSTFRVEDDGDDEAVNSFIIFSILMLN